MNNTFINSDGEEKNALICVGLSQKYKMLKFKMLKLKKYNYIPLPFNYLTKICLLPAVGKLLYYYYNDSLTEYTLTNFL